MKVVRAGILGFCMGVRRAVEIAERASLETGRVVGKRGLVCLKENDISSLPADSTVIIRAHGVSPVIESELSN